MKKKILSLGLLAVLGTSLFGFTYEIKEDWQLIGAMEDIDDLTVFNDTCIDYIWKYDNNNTKSPEWKLHVANGKDYNYCGNPLEKIEKGQGFWVKANSTCNINIGSEKEECKSTTPAPPDIESDCYDCPTTPDEKDNSLYIRNIDEKHNTGILASNLKSLQFDIENYQSGTYSYFAYADHGERTRFHISIFNDAWHIGLGNLNHDKIKQISASQILTEGKHTVKFEFKNETQKELSLIVDNKLLFIYNIYEGIIPEKKDFIKFKYRWFKYTHLISRDNVKCNY